LYPFGQFSKNGAFFEGDLIRESTPKLLLAGTYHYNQKAQRAQGQLGNELFEPKDLTSVHLDAMLKYNGWSFQTAYMSRDTQNALLVDPQGSQNQFVVAGNGIDAQLSYIFRNNVELIGRFSKSNPKSEIASLLPKATEFTMGVTKYIWEHSFKMQAELTNSQLQFPSTETANNWYVRFQIEIGI
jgi:hypothetical protein